MATPSFSVNLSQPTLKLNKQGKGEAVFDITCNNKNPTRMQVEVWVQGDTKKSWFEIAGEPARNFEANTTQRVSVMVDVNEGETKSSAGSYQFGLLVMAANNKEEDFTKSQPCTVQVPKIEEKEPKPFPLGIVLGVVGGVVALIVIVVAVILMSGNGEKETVDEVAMVEDVTGMSIVEATEVLEEQGFKVKEETEPSDKSPGEVLAQDLVDTEEAAGTTITLIVAVGEDTEVADVRGKEIGEATDILEEQGFVVKKVAATSDRQEGEVLAQDLVNTKEAVGTTITLTVAAPAFAEVKDVIGKPFKKAKKILEEKGFVVKKLMEPSDEAPDEVLAQDPGNQSAATGTTVTLTVATRRSVEVEDVIGKTIGEATDILEEQGFVVKEVPKDSEETPGDVLAQNPVSKEEPVGTTVTLTVARLSDEVRVPDVVDADFEDAKEILEELGFRLDTNKEVLATENIGTVTKQEPSKTKKHPRGGKITLTVRAEGVEVPDLKETTIKMAQKTINGLSLDMEVDGYNGTRQKDKIKSTKPNAGEIVRLQTLIVVRPYAPPPPPKTSPKWGNYKDPRRYNSQQMSAVYSYRPGRVRGIEPTIEEPTIGEILEHVGKEEK